MINRYKAESALLITTVIWGGTFAIIKTALGSVSPMLFISFRFSLAAILLLPFVFGSLKKLDSAAIKGGIILGLLYFACFASQTMGLHFTTATKSGFVTGTFVLFTPFFQILIEKKLPGKGNIIGIVLVIVGLVFLSSKGTHFIDLIYDIGSNFNIGDFLTLLCALFYSVYMVYIDIISRKVDYMPLVFMQIAVTAVGGILFAIIFQVTGIESAMFSFTKDLILAIAYTSILSTVITTILQTKFQRFISPTRASIIFSLEPIFAAIVAFFLLSEKISNFGYIGCVLIFSGLLISELMDKTNVKQ